MGMAKRARSSQRTSQHTIQPRTAFRIICSPNIEFLLIYYGIPRLRLFVNRKMTDLPSAPAWDAAFRKSGFTLHNRTGSAKMMTCQKEI